MKKKSRKEKYVKPELKPIKLHADEVLAVGCKSSDTNTPGEPSGCSNFLASCVDNGS